MVVSFHLTISIFVTTQRPFNNSTVQITFCPILIFGKAVVVATVKKMIAFADLPCGTFMLQADLSFDRVRKCYRTR